MKYFVEEEAGPVRQALEDAVLDWPEVTTKRMFGCPAFMAAGKLFTFVVTRGVVLTGLSDEYLESVREQMETEEFRAGERLIGDWVLVPMDGPEDLADIVPFIEASYEGALDKA